MSGCKSLLLVKKESIPPHGIARVQYKQACAAVGPAGLLVGCSGVTAIVMRVLCSVDSQSVQSCAPQMLHEEQLSARPWNGPHFISFVADSLWKKVHESNWVLL